MGHHIKGSMPLPQYLVVPKKQDRTKYGNYRGISIVAHGDKVVLKVIARRLSATVQCRRGTARRVMRLSSATLDHHDDVHGTPTTGNGPTTRDSDVHVLCRPHEIRWCVSIAPSCGLLSSVYAFHL